MVAAAAADNPWPHAPSDPSLVWRAPAWDKSSCGVVRRTPPQTVAVSKGRRVLHPQIIIRLLRACILAIGMAGCADRDGEAVPPLLESPGDVKAAAEGVLNDALELNTAVHSAFGRVKAALESDSVVLFNEIDSALSPGSFTSSHALDRAAEDVLVQMAMTEKSERTAKLYALVRRFAELLSLGRENIPAPRLGDVLDDCVYVSSELEVEVAFSADQDDDARMKSMYYSAPAYNVLVSTHIFALAAGGYNRRALESAYRNAVDTNLQLVGTGQGEDLGRLSEWIDAQTAGTASAREKYDKDPIVYSIRRALEQQQRALE
jgi:hypothetical protein